MFRLGLQSEGMRENPSFLASLLSSFLVSSLPPFFLSFLPPTSFPPPSFFSFYYCFHPSLPCPFLSFLPSLTGQGSPTLDRAFYCTDSTALNPNLIQKYFLRNIWKPCLIWNPCGPVNIKLATISYTKSYMRLSV